MTVGSAGKHQWIYCVQSTIDAAICMQQPRIGGACNGQGLTVHATGKVGL